MNAIEAYERLNEVIFKDPKREYKMMSKVADRSNARAEIFARKAGDNAFDREVLHRSSKYDKPSTSDVALGKQLDNIYPKLLHAKERSKSVATRAAAAKDMAAIEMGGKSNYNRSVIQRIANQTKMSPNISEKGKSLVDARANRSKPTNKYISKK